MSKKRDPYKTLGVARNASADDIKAAFRKKAKKAHPDHGGKPGEFGELKRAQLVLLDPAKRSKFDQTGDMDDDKPAPNPDQGALDVINGMLQSVLGGDTEPTSVPLLKQLVEHIDKEVKLIGENTAKMRRAQVRAEKLKRRFKKKRSKGRKDDGLMDSMLAWHSAQAAMMIDKCERDLQARARAKEILLDYDFEEDPQRPTVMTFYSTTTAG